MADIFEVRTKFNSLEHFGLVQTLMGAGDGGDTLRRLVKMDLNVIFDGRGLRMKHTCHQRQTVIDAMIYFFEKKLIAIKRGS
jgi:hypothetical protein